MYPPSHNSHFNRGQGQSTRSFVIADTALSSNLMYEPSGRHRIFVRTMAALTTSPFLTAPPGVACLTVADNVADVSELRPEPPRATNRFVCRSYQQLLSDFLVESFQSSLDFINNVTASTTSARRKAFCG